MTATDQASALSLTFPYLTYGAIKSTYNRELFSFFKNYFVTNGG